MSHADGKNMKRNLNGEFVLITGCGSGIGLSAALSLHEMGFNVIATARKDGDLVNLRDAGINAIYMEMMDEESIGRAVDEAISISNGNIYGVFHNAGFGQSGALEDLPIEALRNQFQVNLFGAHEINLRLIPLMRKAGRGRIVWNSSILGFFAMPYRGMYNSSKFAMEGMADTLRLELVGSGVKVSIIEPGPISTKFRENSLFAFNKYVDRNSSVHCEKYQGMVARLGKVGDTSKFTLPAGSCVECLIDALCSKNPKPRYRVTTPTKIMYFLKRIFPTVLLDKMAMKGF
jgi:NAD(P)-dependent dehydrogenase (short-subunit alcohol dehydrogenase family)